MYAKKTFKLLGSNFGVYLKSLIYQILLLCLAVAVFGLFFVNLGKAILNAVQENGLVSQAQALIFDIANWDSIVQGDFSQRIIEFIDSVRESIAAVPNFGSRIITAVWVFLIASYIVYFLLELSVYPTFFSVNSFMTTNTRFYYLWTVVKKSVDSIRLMSVRTVFCLVSDWCCMFLTVGAYLVALFSMGVFGLILSFIIWIVLFSLRNTLLAYWLPVNINETAKVRLAFKKSVILMLDDFWLLFLKTVIVVTSAFLAVCVVACIFKPLVVVILMVLILSLVSFLLNCIYFVGYFEAKGKPYFVKKVLITDNND